MPEHSKKSDTKTPKSGVKPGPPHRFQKGNKFYLKAVESGKIGRPKGSISMATELRKLLSKPDEDGRARAAKLMESLCKAAEGGDVRALKIILDRIDGKVPEVRASILSNLSHLSDAQLKEIINKD